MAGADGDTSAGGAAARLMRAADRLENLTPAMAVLCEDWQTQTSDAFRNERSPAGEAWPELSPVTLERRIAKLPGHNRRTKKTGTLTKSARGKRKASRALANLAGRGVNARAFLGVKILVDTGHFKNSIRYEASETGATISIAAHGEAHVDGAEDGSLPKRNPLVIERSESGEGHRLIPREEEKLRGAINGTVMEALTGSGRKVA